MLASCKSLSHWWKIMIYSYNGVIYWASLLLFSDFGFSFWCGDNVWNNITSKLVSINDEYSFMKSGTHPLNLWWCLRNWCWTPVEGVYCVRSWIWFTGLLFSVRISFICHKKKSKENHILVVHRIIAALSVRTLWHYFLFFKTWVKLCTWEHALVMFMVLLCLSLVLVSLLRFLIFFFYTYNARVLFKRGVK